MKKTEDIRRCLEFRASSFFFKQFYFIIESKLYWIDSTRFVMNETTLIDSVIGRWLQPLGDFSIRPKVPKPFWFGGSCSSSLHWGAGLRALFKRSVVFVQLYCLKNQLVHLRNLRRATRRNLQNWLRNAIWFLGKQNLVDLPRDFFITIIAFARISSGLIIFLLQPAMPDLQSVSLGFGHGAGSGGCPGFKGSVDSGAWCWIFNNLFLDFFGTECFRHVWFGMSF